MPADEDVSIGLVVVVVPQLLFAGCANSILGTQTKLKAKRKIRIGDKDLVAVFFKFSLLKQVVARVGVSVTFLKKLSNENITSLKEIRTAERA